MIKNSLAKKFERLNENLLTIVCAPDGSGKTSSINRFLQQMKWDHVLVNITQTSDMSLVWKELLQEACEKQYAPKSICRANYPKTLQSVKSVIEKWDAHLKDHLVVVVDDYEDQKCVAFTEFLCSLSRLHSKHLHFIVLTQRIRDFQLLKIFEENNTPHLFGRDFKLNEADVLGIAKKRNITLSKEEAKEVLEFSAGWLPAIDIAFRSIQNGGTLYTTSGLHELMQKGSFKNYSDEVKEGLMKLSVLKEFSLEQALYICESKATIRELDNLEMNKMYVKKKNLQKFHFTSSFGESLKQALMMSDIDSSLVYRRAGNWFLLRGDRINALMMYWEGNNFIDIIHVIESNEYSLIHEAPKLVVDIFKRMPMEYKYNYPYIYLMHIFDLITNIDNSSGKKLLERFYEDLQEGYYKEDKQQLLGEYYLMKAVSHFNNSKAMLENFQLACEAFQDGHSKVAYPMMIASFGSCHILYLYHNQLGQLGELVKTANKEAKNISRIFQGVTSGFEYQVSAEYSFMTGNYGQVLGHAEVAYKEAFLQKQTSLCICSLFVQARYALFMNDKLLYKKVMSKIRKIYDETKLEVLMHELDCALAYLYLIQDKSEFIADWIKEGDISTLKIMHEAWGISFIMMLLYHLKNHDYEKVKICCDIAEVSLWKKNHLFGVMFVKLGRAVMHFKKGNTQKAFTYWREVMEIASADTIITMFIEFQDIIFDLFEAYEKNTAFEQSLFALIENRRMNGSYLGPFDRLTNKENEVVNLFVNSMTSKEVADMLVISENTVRTHLKNIYVKLDINKKTELVQLYEQYKKY